MIFYSIQKKVAYDEAKKIGYLTGNIKYIDEYFVPACQWMMEQMKKRLPSYKGEFPIWLWADKKSLDYSELINKDNVLFKINIPKENVLASNFFAWHHILNNTDIEDKNLPKEESWELIFNDALIKEIGYGDLKQYTIGKLSINDVIIIKSRVSKILFIIKEKVFSK